LEKIKVGFTLSKKTVKVLKEYIKATKTRTSPGQRPSQSSVADEAIYRFCSNNLELLKQEALNGDT
jgi:hypothetical protein